jgi:hypothetical protein
MGFRPTKVSEHTIAHELRDMTCETDDLASHRILVAAHHLAHLLGIEVGAKLSPPDQIAEEDR